MIRMTVTLTDGGGWDLLLKGSGKFADRAVGGSLYPQYFKDEVESLPSAGSRLRLAIRGHS
jgi:hypothetical protein